MASNDLERFLGELQGDTGLQEELRNANGDNDLIAKAVAMATAKGYSFSADDIREYMSKVTAEGELNENELDNVAGGYFWTNHSSCGAC